jgi:hypothetical protein
MNQERMFFVSHFSLLVVLSTAAAFAMTYPQLPTAVVDVTCCPPVTRTIPVHTAAQLQTALDKAQLGDEIVLDAGSTYEGNFILRALGGTNGWVTIRSSAASSLPSPGTRVGDRDAVYMAKIMSPNYGDPGDPSGPAVGVDYQSTNLSDLGVHHYRFIGIEFATGLTCWNYHVIFIAPQSKGVPFSPVTMPHDIIIERCLIHGNDPITTTFPNGAGQLNGSVLFSVANGAIVDSKLYNLWGAGQETQVLADNGGPGPRLIQNNELSGGTEGFIAGGGLLPYSDRIPTDITVVHNYFNHPAAWQTSTTVVPFIKNLFELKVGKRVRFTDNLLEGNWDLGGGQRGYAITLTPRPVQDSGGDSGAIIVPAILAINEVSDVVMAHNVVRKVGGFISTGLMDNYCAIYSVSCIQSARLLVSDNVADFDTAYRYDGRTIPAGAISDSTMQDFSVKRNTFLGHNNGGGSPGPSMWGNRPHSICTESFGVNFEWSSNINLNGVSGDCTYDPAYILGTSWTGTISVTSNLVANVDGAVLAAWSAFGHDSRIALDESSLMLTADKLSLQPSSPYSGMGIGANLSCFNEAAVRNGTPSQLCPLPPEVQQAGTPPPPDSPPTAIAPEAFTPHIYPNPWRKDRHSGNIHFDQLVIGGTINLFTVSGHKVKELSATATSVPWDLTNDSGGKVASGIYVYVITDGRGNKAKGKVAIIK